MADPFIGEIRIFGFNFAPQDWAFCNGQLLPLSQYSTLFAILGTTYGGDGRNNFGLPNLEGQVVIGTGTGPGLTPRDLGEAVGSATVALVGNEFPPHSHGLNSTNATNNPDLVSAPSAGARLSAEIRTAPTPDAALKAYSNAAATNTSLHPTSIGFQGTSVAHANVQPYLTMNFCIALFGVFPPRS